MKWWPLVLVAVAVVTVSLLLDPTVLLWFMGMYPVPAGTSVMYQFWSGFYIVMVTVVTSNWLRKQNCHVEWCWRTGRYPVVDGAFLVCRHHSPDPEVRHGKVSFEHIVHMHQKTQAGRNNPEG